MRTMEREYVDLQALQQQVKEGLAERFPDRLWVKAEIAQWAPHRGGHCYLSLVQHHGGETVAEARAVIWRSRYELLRHFFEEETGTPLQAGLTVLVRVQVTFHEVYGYSLVIDDLDPAFTVGELALERRRTLERLAAEGYMELQRELGLPRVPYRLAVISARTAAGYGDFCKHLTENAYGFRFDVRLFEALMQGTGAPASIIGALGRIAAEPRPFDAVLLLRGGGSELDLACFDDYDLAVAIASFAIPVFTAIGHERDVHVADLVAHRSVKTPTALADLFLAAYMEEDERISGLALRIRNALQGLVQVREQRCTGLGQRIRYAASSRCALEESRVALAEAKIAAADPRTLLSRGYALVTGADGRLLKGIAGVAKGQRIAVRFADGSLRASVEEIQRNHEESRNI